MPAVLCRVKGGDGIPGIFSWANSAETRLPLSPPPLPCHAEVPMRWME